MPKFSTPNDTPHLSSEASFSECIALWGGGMTVCAEFDDQNMLRLLSPAPSYGLTDRLHHFS